MTTDQLLNQSSQQIAATYRTAYANHYANPTQTTADNLRKLAAAFRVVRETENLR